MYSINVKSLLTSLTRLPKRKADFIEPMDCAPVSRLPDGSRWLFEIKLDGYRAIAVKADGRVNLYSRRHKSFDHQYPLIVEALGELPEGTVVDGEVVALDESGRPNFNLLQHLRSEASRIHYFISDLLICHGRDLPGLPLSERRELVKSFLKLRSGYNACRTSTASVTQPALEIERVKFFLRFEHTTPQRPLPCRQYLSQRSRNCAEGIMLSCVACHGGTSVILIQQKSAAQN